MFWNWKSVTVLILAGLYFSRNFCSINELHFATYEEIKDLPSHPEKLLIDVREPDELKETGWIPSSINIPLADIQKALSNETSPAQFKKLYGRDKPDLDTSIIFTCTIGVRAQTALEFAVGLGYTKGKAYIGSWLDWAEKEKLQQ